MSRANFVEVRAKRQLMHKGELHKADSIFAVLVEDAVKLVEQGFVEVLQSKPESPSESSD